MGDEFLAMYQAEERRRKRAEGERDALRAEVERLTTRLAMYSRYSDGIAAAIGDDRERRETGEPGESDALAIMNLRGALATARAEVERLRAAARLAEEALRAEAFRYRHPGAPYVTCRSCGRDDNEHAPECIVGRALAALSTNARLALESAAVDAVNDELRAERDALRAEVAAATAVLDGLPAVADPSLVRRIRRMCDLWRERGYDVPEDVAAVEAEGMGDG